MSKRTRDLRFKGAKILTEQMPEVTDFGPDLERLVKAMFATMRACKGIGLAAPQVGVRLAVAVVDTGDGDPLVLINPVLLSANGPERSMREACLSLPREVHSVTRREHAVVEAAGLDGVRRRLSGQGMKGRAIQHELDHLAGVCIDQRSKQKVLV